MTTKGENFRAPEDRSLDGTTLSSHSLGYEKDHTYRLLRLFSNILQASQSSA